MPGTAEAVSGSLRRGRRPCSAVPRGWQHASKDGRWYPSLCMPLTGHERPHAVMRVLLVPRALGKTLEGALETWPKSVMTT